MHDCVICRFLKGLGLDENTIEKYHNSEIEFKDLPKNIREELENYYVFMSGR